MICLAWVSRFMNEKDDDKIVYLLYFFTCTPKIAMILYVCTCNNVPCTKIDNIASCELEFIRIENFKFLWNP